MNHRGNLVPAGMPFLRQFISWRWLPNNEGGYDKVPCDANGNSVSGGAYNRSIWGTFEEVAARGFNVGFTIAEKGDIFLIDLDKCYDPVNRLWSAQALEIINQFRGAYMELSVSGTGLHIVGRGARALPDDHRTRIKSMPGVEIYTSYRFFALGTPLAVPVSPDTDMGPQLLSCATRIFGGELRRPVAVIEDGRDEAWNGPEDDAELIARALAQGTVTRTQMFEGKPTFRQLWELDAAVLAARYPAAGRRDGLPYDASNVDAVMMAELSYFTGRDRPRMARIFQTWQGYRPHKYQGRGAYRLPRVIGVGALNRNVLKLPARPAVPALGAPAGAAGGEVIEGGMGALLAYLPNNTYYHKSSRKFWTSKSVDNVLPRVMVGLKSDGITQSYVPATKWISQNAPIHDMTWWPGAPEIIGDLLILDGEMVETKGVRVLNTYRAPTPPRPTGIDVQPWLNHIAYLYPENWQVILRWMAFVAQNPSVKVNWAIVLGGGQRIGKDTILHPLKRAVGAWNMKNIKPHEILDSIFTEYLQCRVLVVDEVKDTGDGSRFEFYNRMKTVIAAPPGTHRVNPKGSPAYVIPNLNATIMTTNYLNGGMYLAPDDGRHFVAWSEIVRKPGDDDYYRQLWDWLNNGGTENCAAYLLAMDMSGFDAKSPPEKTEAFWSMVDDGKTNESHELEDMLVNREAIMIEDLAMIAMTEFNDHSLADWLKDRKNGSKIKKMMTENGWIIYKNKNMNRGKWFVKRINKQRTIYIKSTIPKEMRDNIVNSYIS